METFRARSLIVVALVGLMSACGSGSDDGTDLAGEALTAVANVDFESYPTGPLGAPWSVSQTGASTISVVTTADHGKVLAMHGSTTEGDFLTAGFPFSSSDSLLHVQVDVKPAAGASFIFDVKGAGSSISARRVRLQRSPGSDALVASSSGTADLTCGNLASGVWSTLSVDIRAAQSPHTFTVLINGQPIACTNATTNMGSPFTGINVMDPSNAAWGGDVQFDNLSAGSGVQPCTPGTPTPPTTVLDVNFNTTPLGALGAPWSVVPSTGSSTVRIIDSSGHGRALRLHGSTTNGATVVAALSFSSSQPAIVLDFAVKPAAGSSFVFALNGAGGSIGARRIRLQRAPGSSTLVASTAGVGNLDCGALASGVWSSVELAVHTQRSPHTFDVRINGAATACTGATTEMGAPFNSVSVMDASNAGWCGDVEFDDILAKASTEATCNGSP
jgi:uncharacterized Zn-binding protein involved in type VI secretion